MPAFRLRSNRPLLVLATAQSLVAMLFYVPVSALFLTSRGLTFSDIFVLEAILLVAILSAEVPTGMLADRLNRKVVLSAGYVTAALAEVLFALGFGFPTYVVSFLLSGLSIALLSGAQEAYAYEALGADADDRAVAAFGRLSAIGLTASVVAAAVGSLLALVDIGLPALLAAIAHMAAAVVILTLLPGRAVAPRANATERPGRLPAAVRTMLRSPVLLYGAFTSGTGFVIFNAVHTLNQPMFGDAGIPVGWFGPIVAAGMLSAALANNLLGRIERRTGRGPLVVLATAGGGAGFGLLATPSPVVSIVGFGIVVTGMNLCGPVLSAITNRLVEDAQRATVLSVMSFTGSLAGVAANVALAGVAGQSRRAAALAAGGMLLVFGAIWIPVAARHLRRDLPGGTVEGAECSSAAAPEPG